ncbi:MAG TPA: gamma-glutamyl-gamma-aminobutyrate hydrolase family protein [Polyangia bacterium]|jgi:putative glutamine amidotransferase
MKPRIVVPFWEEQYLQAYADAIRREGAEVVPAPMQEATAAAPFLDGAAGLMLIGGGDVEPARYGAGDPAGLCRHVEPRRDAFELEALARALARDLPTFGICRGHQVLAVACGGALVRDIPTEVPGSLRHSRPKEDLDAHQAALAPGSRLAGIMGAADLLVNSRHHQAVRADRPGAGLRVTARAPDGVVEALESERHGFVVSVQWHPENFALQGDRFAPLFRAFVARAAGGRLPPTRECK